MINPHRLTAAQRLLVGLLLLLVALAAPGNTRASTDGLSVGAVGPVVTPTPTATTTATGPIISTLRPGPVVPSTNDPAGTIAASPSPAASPTATATTAPTEAPTATAAPTTPGSSRLLWLAAVAGVVAVLAGVAVARRARAH